MTPELMNVRRLHQPLQDAGLEPRNCRVMDISIGVSGAVLVRYEIFLSVQETIVLGRLLADVATAIAAEAPPQTKDI